MRDVLRCLARVPPWGMLQQDSTTLRLIAAMLGQIPIRPLLAQPKPTSFELRTDAAGHGLPGTWKRFVVSHEVALLVASKPVWQLCDTFQQRRAHTTTARDTALLDNVVALRGPEVASRTPYPRWQVVQAQSPAPPGLSNPRSHQPRGDP